MTGTQRPTTGTGSGDDGLCSCDDGGDRATTSRGLGDDGSDPARTRHGHSI